jgi:hypothetical protein
METLIAEACALFAPSCRRAPLRESSVTFVVEPPFVVEPSLNEFTKNESCITLLKKNSSPKCLKFPLGDESHPIKT